MNQLNAFTIPIFQRRVEDWDTHKEKILSLLDLADCGAHYTDFHKNDDSDEPPSYFEDVIEVLKPAMEEFASSYPREVAIKLMWAQKYQSNHYHGVHCHGATGYSAIFYAQFEENHSGTTFYAPFSDFMTGKHLEYTPKVSEGDIIFFPSTILHECRPVQSDKERIVISFNVV